MSQRLAIASASALKSIVVKKGDRIHDRPFKIETTIVAITLKSTGGLPFLAAWLCAVGIPMPNRCT